MFLVLPALAACTSLGPDAVRGSWFYIDDSDLDSKSTFSMLMQLFALQSGNSDGMTPVLTIPVGG